ncbi:sorbosone dehydrogenase family protein [Mitsuaria sp. GD03876]|uniref:PQQ-dependent sugar dehydrogenase n=1 Tax=Mitsuaria sp. GD03876 TaxID=2975399 RepID=UPI0024490010|nr:sorbosone dehydrogenase family protein [Mitsuaria sp. GD03876]MDH0866104.1 sorbosone dehydrogenase family protein [Mitsuaria sp. GD03876]
MNNNMPAPARSRRRRTRIALASAALAALAACGIPTVRALEAQPATPPGYGPNPALPEPQKGLLPTINVAKAVGWPAGAKPQAATGLAVARFADKLDHPRWVYTLPNGDVLVAETNAPVRPDDGKGPKAWITKQFQKKAGATPKSANRITLLRDTDGDGVADQRFAFAEGLHSPFGMALVGNMLYVANTDAVVRFPYANGQTRLGGQPVKVADLPGGSINHHWTKSLIANAEGTKLYAGIGSNSNVAENGIENEQRRAAILEIDLQAGTTRVFASGLRNPVGLAWEPTGKALWVSVNERDELGDDLVPDYITSVQDGGFYGWPYSWYGKHVDERVKPQRPELVEKAIVPDYAVGAHTASLGLASADGNKLTQDFAHGMFVGQHGSWNRKVPAGYKVIFVPFVGAKPSGMPVDVLTGFLNDKGEAMGRPVGVALDRRGALLVADDVGNVIWRVTATGAAGPNAAFPAAAGAASTPASR